MSENMKKFLDAVRESEELQDKLNGAGKEEIPAIAKEAGFDVSVTDIEEAAGSLSGRAKGELSDNELENVAGGWRMIRPSSGGVAHKHSYYVRLTEAEASKLKSMGYELKTNFWYSKGDYFEIYHPNGGSILDIGKTYYEKMDNAYSRLTSLLGPGTRS